MGATVFHAGKAESGQGAKICNSTLLGVLMSGTVESLALGVRNGMNSAVLSEVMKYGQCRHRVGISIHCRTSPAIQEFRYEPDQPPYLGRSVPPHRPAG